MSQTEVNQLKFLELSKKYEKVKSELQETKEELTEMMLALGVGIYFQDPETLAVYHVVKPKGKFVSFDDVGYERTALEGESRGSLSKKEAQEKGFTLTRE
jgi:hypothetical protein